MRDLAGTNHDPCGTAGHNAFENGVAFPLRGKEHIRSNTSMGAAFATP